MSYKYSMSPLIFLWQMTQNGLCKPCCCFRSSRTGCRSPSPNSWACSPGFWGCEMVSYNDVAAGISD